MKNDQILALIKQKIGILILVGVLVSALSFLFLVVTEKNFKVSTDFLVIQSQSGSQDYYSLSKSAEYISKILSGSVYSELFIDEVVNTGKVDKEFLPFDKKKKLEEWSEIVKVKRNFQLGIVGVEAFGNSQRNTINLSNGIAEVLTTKNSLFVGENKNISVKILSGPIIEKNPSLNKIISVAVGGFLLGVLISFTWMYYRRAENGGAVQSSNGEYKESLKYLDS